jgi:hypothetical protein
MNNADENPGPTMVQAHECGGIKPVNGTQTTLSMTEYAVAIQI